jgi:ketosteroid isomerase-like protein
VRELTMRDRLAVLVALVALAVARDAHAGGERAGARALIATQARALTEMALGDGMSAFVDTFTDDALVFTSAEVATGHEEIEKAAIDVFEDTHDSIEKAVVERLQIGVLDDAAWLTADLVLSWEGHGGEGESVDYEPVTTRVTELVIRDGDHWRTRAAHFSEAVSDRDARERQHAKYADEPPADLPSAGDDPDRIALLESPALLAATLGTGKAITVIGSSGGERAVGVAKARKLLKRWRKLRFTVAGGVAWTTGDGWAYAAANVQSGTSDAAVTYRVLALFGRHGDAWTLVSIHYSVAA